VAVLSPSYRLGGDCRGGLGEQIGSIEIVLAGNADQGKQRIAPGIAQRSPRP
jgi:hypothetical protein